MTTIKLKFPVGLIVDIKNVLKPIKSKIIEHHQSDPEITVEYIGCEDNYIELLKTVRNNYLIKIISE